MNWCCTLLSVIIDVLPACMLSYTHTHTHTVPLWPSVSRSVLCYIKWPITLPLHLSQVSLLMFWVVLMSQAAWYISFFADVCVCTSKASIQCLCASIEMYKSYLCIYISYCANYYLVGWLIKQIIHIRLCNGDCSSFWVSRCFRHGMAWHGKAW